MLPTEVVEREVQTAYWNEFVRKLIEKEKKEYRVHLPPENGNEWKAMSIECKILSGKVLRMMSFI